MPIPAGSIPLAPPTTGPLVYDPVLSRVRINLSGLRATDAFGRTVSAGWGTADTGQVWSVTDGTAAQHSVTGSVAQHSVNALNTLFRDRLDVDYADFDLLMLAKVSVSPTGLYLRHQVDFRFVDALNYYAARVHIQTSGAIDLMLIRVLGGVESTLQAAATGQTHVPGTALVFDVQTRGSQLRAKVWRDGLTPPLNWQVEVTDASHPSGAVTVASLLPPGNTNTLPVAVQYDGLTVIPTLTVQRSTDQNRWTTVRGGFEMVPDAGVLRLDDYEFTPDTVNYYRVGNLFSGSIVPPPAGVWLKSLARPFLNRQVVVRDYSDVGRRSRAGVFDVKGRSLPVAVTDVRGSRQWTLDVNTYSDKERSGLDLLLASGDVLLVQVPPNAGRISAVPSGYVLVGDSREATPPTAELEWRVFSLPLTEVAAPGPDVVGTTSTWQSVLNAYATWAEVLAAHPTWADLQELIGDGTEVIVS
ncbi:hypothetical protein [Micromonospora sp. CA-248212]|uniref:hypothetical protein n=1 Tax=Micromonospora sp. CA-248212 TaxID=3239961 RepID=UPI003D93C3B7